MSEAVNDDSPPPRFLFSHSICLITTVFQTVSLVGGRDGYDRERPPVMEGAHRPKLVSQTGPKHVASVSLSLFRPCAMREEEQEKKKSVSSW